MNPQFRYFLRQTPATSVLLALNVVTYIAYFFYRDVLVYLAGDPRVFPWTALTYSVLDISMPLFWVIGLLFFWWVGSYLEQVWGTAKFVLVWVVLALVCQGFFLGLTGRPAPNLWYPFACLTVAWTVLNEGAQIRLYMILPITAKIFRYVTLLSVIWMIGMIGGPLAGIVSVLPCLMAWWYARRALGRQILPFRSGAGKPKPKSRAKLNLVPNEAPARVATLPPAPSVPTPLEKDIDRILDKIRIEGMNALTPEEKNLLDEHSSRLRRGN